MNTKRIYHTAAKDAAAVDVPVLETAVDRAVIGRHYV